MIKIDSMKPFLNCWKDLVEVLMALISSKNNLQVHARQLIISAIVSKFLGSIGHINKGKRMT